MKKFLLIVFIPAAIQAMELNSGTLQAMDPSPISCLPPELLTNEIMQRCMQSGSIKERRKTIQQLAMVSKFFNQGVKKFLDKKKELAWIICDTPKKYQEKPSDETLAALREKIIGYMERRKKKLRPKESDSRWLQLYTTMTNLDEIAQLFKLNSHQLTFLLNIAVPNKQCNPLIALLILAGADEEGTLFKHYSWLYADEFLSERREKGGHMNALLLAIVSANVEAVEQLLVAQSKVTSDWRSDTSGSRLLKNVVKKIGEPGIGYSSIGTALMWKIPEPERLQIFKLLFAHGATMRMDPTSPLEIAKCRQQRNVATYSQELFQLLEEKEQEAKRKEEQEEKKKCVIQ